MTDATRCGPVCRGGQRAAADVAGRLMAGGDAAVGRDGGACVLEQTIVHRAGVVAGKGLRGLAGPALAISKCDNKWRINDGRCMRRRINMVTRAVAWWPSARPRLTYSRYHFRAPSWRPFFSVPVRGRCAFRHADVLRPAARCACLRAAAGAARGIERIAHAARRDVRGGAKSHIHGCPCRWYAKDVI